MKTGDFVLFLEVKPGDASAFSEVLHVQGVDVGGHHVLRCTSPAIPNAIAGLLLDLRDKTYSIPHAYFGWTEGQSLCRTLLKFLAFGEGDTAPVCREVLGRPSQSRNAGRGFTWARRRRDTSYDIADRAWLGWASSRLSPRARISSSRIASTSARQLASMTLSETPTVAQLRA